MVINIQLDKANATTPVDSAQKWHAVLIIHDGFISASSAFAWRAGH
jgi:hypothetical protein